MTAGIGIPGAAEYFNPAGGYMGYSIPGVAGTFVTTASGQTYWTGTSMAPPSADEGFQGMAAQAAGLDFGDVDVAKTLGSYFQREHGGQSGARGGLTRDLSKWFARNPSAAWHSVVSGIPTARH
jgi:hypothetical protein